MYQQEYKIPQYNTVCPSLSISLILALLSNNSCTISLNSCSAAIKVNKYSN